MNKKEININRSHSHIDRDDLKWEEIEVKHIRERIINLRSDQIAALTWLVGVKFYRNDLEEVALEIKKEKHNSVNIDAIIYEASSKEDLLWWLNYFEKENKK